jgi:hypothetical protein
MDGLIVVEIGDRYYTLGQAPPEVLSSTCSACVFNKDKGSDGLICTGRDSLQHMCTEEDNKRPGHPGHCFADIDQLHATMLLVTGKAKLRRLKLKETG